MTSTTDLSLAEQRRALREQLRAQRQLIADRLGPAPEANGGYPRSKTMRFLTQRSALTAVLLAEFVALLVGARFVKSSTAVRAMARIVRSASVAKRRQLPASRTSASEAPPIS